MSDLITQATATNETLDVANGVRYAYRRFGNTGTPVPPVVLLQHFRGNLDNWDPMLVDAVASQREVILVDYVGVGGSTGSVATTVRETAVGVIAFIDALGLKTYDLFGFSLGGFVAQEITLIRPHQVRRVVLAGTGPEGGRRMHRWEGEILEAATRDEPGPEDILTLFFARTETSRSKGSEFLQRIFSREQGRDQDTDLATRDAQIIAVSTWGIPDESRLNRLSAIHQPVLVANGENDLMVPTENTHLLAERIPDATLLIYPDAGHGFLDQYPVEFASEVNKFLG